MPSVFIDPEAEAEAIGVAPGGLVSIVNRGISEGWSQRATISVARNLDLSFSDRSFRTLWHHQEAVAANMADVLAHPPDVPMSPQLVTGSEWGKVGKYYYWITIVRRIPGSGEIVEDTTVQSADDLRSADEVVGDMFDQWSEHEAEYGPSSGLATVGAYVYNVTSRTE